MATHSSILAYRMPQRSLVGYSPWGHKDSDAAEPHTHIHTTLNQRTPSTSGDTEPELGIESALHQPDRRPRTGSGDGPTAAGGRGRPGPPG